MTRVNLIPVEDLMDQHLVAEYRELVMVPASLKRTLASKNGLNLKKISKQYTLNTGHVTFFYDKGKFLSDRYQLLIAEMKKRKMNPDPNRIFPIDVFVSNNLYKDYTPNAVEIAINKARIDERISRKPAWYRKTTY